MAEEDPAILPMLYEYPYDFTDYAGVLEAQVVGAEPSSELASVLAKVTGDPWTTEPKQAYTLYKASVTYLGDNLITFPTSKRYDYVLAITLSARYKNRIIYLVFNTPA